MAGGTIAIVGDGTVGAAGVLGKKDTILQSPESVKPDCFKLFELRMKSKAACRKESHPFQGYCSQRELI